jgi:diguanylate cyclase (GGDEF)-like protein
MTDTAVMRLPSADRIRALRLPMLVAASVAGGAVCVVLALIAMGSSAPPTLWRLALAVMVVAVADYGVLHLRFGRETCTLTWSEAAMLIALVLAPWPWVALTCALGVVISQLAARRAVLKIAFNAGSMAIGAGLATFVVHVVAGTVEIATVSTAQRFLALVAATIAYFVWNTASVATVISAAGGRRLREVWHDGLGLKTGMLAGNTLVALLLVSAPWQGSAGVLIPFCMVLLYLTYRAYHRATRESDVWRQLDAAAKELSLLDGAGVARAAVARAVTLFNADFAEIVLAPEADGERRLFRHDLAGPTNAAAIVEAPLTAAAAADADVIGILRLGMSDRLSERQHTVLRTFANSVGTSLQNARLYAEMRHQAAVSAYEAARDPLTGIANRKVLHTELGRAIEDAERTGLAVGLLLIDLDHFKDINDTLGHHTGDAVLCAVALRLCRAVSSGDLVARLGGDEFAIVVRGMTNPADAEIVARRLLAVLADVVEYEALHIAVDGSIGIACYPEDGTNADDLLRLADTALYQAKEPRGAISRYRSDRDDNSVDRITLAGDLRNAISSKQFFLHYQAQVDLTSGNVIGAEALARWKHPTLGLLAPDKFIHLVERSGLVREFALSVLDDAVREASLWYRLGSAVPVSVNLSARNLIDPRLARDVADILTRHGLPADRLILELTETAMITDARQVKAVLAQLRQIGVQLSVDDFGTGFSSLAFLQRVALNEIKIDRSFVHGMTASESDAVIVRATIDLAHGLGVRVVAEGVETLQHVIMLRALGCDAAQGWHYGKPAAGPHLRSSWLGLDDRHGTAAHGANGQPPASARQVSTRPPRRLGAVPGG